MLRISTFLEKYLYYFNEIFEIKILEEKNTHKKTPQPRQK